MGRRKTPAERLLNQERCIQNVLRQDNFKYIIYNWICASTITIFISIDTHTTPLLTSIYTNTETHRHHLLLPLLETYSNELFRLMLDWYTQTFTQIDTIYFKKIVEINSNGLVKLLFISIEKKNFTRCCYTYAYLQTLLDSKLINCIMLK